MMFAAAFASLTASNVMMIQPAEARPKCYYIAHDAFGNMMADGHAGAAMKSWAAIAELERKCHQGKADRGSCRRVANY